MKSYKDKLESLKQRRTGIDSRSIALDSASATNLYKSIDLYNTENYEKRGKGEATKYALGAMEEVGQKYTEISINEGKRVANQLSSELEKQKLSAEFELQGSVPLNIHIRGVSDVDLLVLHGDFVGLDWSGPDASNYTPLPNTPTTIEKMLHLRKTCEAALALKFPVADINTKGDKSIALSGGSLRRKVDVVPSHWFDTANYQTTKLKQDREVRILNKSTKELLANMPFLHMKKINEKDESSLGGAKKTIRLLKTLKNDSEREITLSSYDIASLVWHFNTISMIKPNHSELSLLIEAEFSIEKFITDKNSTIQLSTPDLSRKIITNEKSWLSLIYLKMELTELIKEIAKEIDPYTPPTTDSIKKKLQDTIL